MDMFWRLLRIVVLGFAGLIVLGIGSCAVFARLDGLSKDRARDRLWIRSTELLRERKSNPSTVRVSELFGGDVDGVCVVWDGPADEHEMRDASPAKFANAIKSIVQKRDTQGWDSDIYYWFVYAVRNGRIERQYDLVFKSAMEIDGLEQDGCFDRDAPVTINRAGKDSLTIRFQQPHASP